VLKFLAGEPFFEKWEPEKKLLVAKAEAVWRAFLLGEEPHPGVYRQHILPLDAISNSTFALPQNINRYLMRAIDMDICHGNSTIFVYAKLGRFMVIGIVHEVNPNHWQGTKVHANGGTIKPRHYAIPLKFMNYLNEKAARMFKSFDSVTDRQRQKIESALRSNVDSYIGSDAFIAMTADIRMHGNAAFSKRGGK
jgi:hypothetical protein